MPVYEVQDADAPALEAASAFYARHLPLISLALAASQDQAMTLVFPPADHSHIAWRRAAVQELARAHAPRRINGIAGTGQALVAAVRYLDGAAGVTGQYLCLDDAGAGAVLGQQA